MIGRYKQEIVRENNVDAIAGQNQQYCFQLEDLDHRFHILVYTKDNSGSRTLTNK